MACGAAPAIAMFAGQVLGVIGMKTRLIAAVIGISILGVMLAASGVESGSVVAWGWNVEGQCNVPSPNSGFVVIAAGRGEHSEFLSAKGGERRYERHTGVCEVPADEALGRESTLRFPASAAKQQEWRCE